MTVRMPLTAPKCRTAHARKQPDKTANNAQEHSLGQELEADVVRCGTHRLPDPNFASALGDTYEHDVHDPDAADQQGHARDPCQQRSEGGCRRFLRGNDVLLRGDRKIGGVGGHFVPLIQQELDLSNHIVQ